MTDGLDIRLFPDTALRYVTPPLRDWDEPGSKDGRLRELVLQMGAVCQLNGGSGLAANQLGLGVRMFVLMETVSPPAQPGAFAFCNPEVVGVSAETETVTEGCLSMPDLGVDVERPLQIRLRFQDTYGEEREEEFVGWDARVIQHETDHLNGKLMTDYLDRREMYRMLTAWQQAVRGKGRYRRAA